MLVEGDHAGSGLVQPLGVPSGPGSDLEHGGSRLQALAEPADRQVDLLLAVEPDPSPILPADHPAVERDVPLPLQMRRQPLHHPDMRQVGVVDVDTFDH